VNVEQLLKNAYSQNYTYLIKTPIDQYKVIVEAEDQQRSEPTDVKRLYFKPAGAQNIIPNQTVTDPQTSVGRLSVNHINQFPAVTLYFNLEPGVATGGSDPIHPARCSGSPAADDSRPTSG
jgi:hydrophobic/amphiphilic exporter-1 (mainly G- bacteria), HAE1 family